MKKGFAFKSLNTYEDFNGEKTLQSGHDRSSWELNAWRKDERTPKACQSGFHCFKMDGANWIDWGDTLCIVQVAGEFDKDREEGDPPGWTKYAYQRMRIVKVLDIDDEFAKDLILELADKIEGFDIDHYDTPGAPLGMLEWAISDAGGSSGQRVLRAILQVYAPEYL